MHDHIKSVYQGVSDVLGVYQGLYVIFVKLNKFCTIDQIF